MRAKIPPKHVSYYPIFENDETLLIGEFIHILFV